ncbi:MAG: hypothetical protein NTY47_08755, partial [Candidatus Omnitrophica bacterium]|nr:hypothetical protein [Candidatus Omnitrophota bacterium]
MRNLNNKKGVLLVAVMAIMVITAALCTVLASLVAETTRATPDYLRSSQALGLAQAGLNWYMQRLAGVVNWTAEVNQTGVALGPGTFDVTLSNKALPQTDSTTATAMDVSVTGNVTGANGVTIKRTMAQHVWKLPSASKFALFWGRRTGTNLTLSSSTINGDYWSQGSSTFTGSTINKGTAYRPATESITGVTSTAISYPYFSNFTGATSTFSTPALNTAYYTGLITTYNTAISGCSSSSTVNQNTNLVLTGNTVCCRTFNTNSTNNSNVTISGNGIIVANRDITLASTSGTNRTLTITPSGGNILILAGRTLTINAATGSNVVTINSGTRIYSADNNTTADLTTINNNNTNINGSIILANRRTIVQNSANITGSTLFVNYPGDTTNNYLQVTGSGTSVGTAA